MKLLILFVTSGLLLFGVYYFVSQTPKTAARELQAHDITNAIAKGAVLIDVRSPEEFAEQHATGAINMPLQQLQGKDFGALQKDQQIFLYCRTGNRSGQAQKILEAAGYTQVSNIISLQEWQKMGGAVE